MISSAVECGSLILVYDELGNMLFSVPNHGLIGCTGSAVAIRAGSVSYVYGEHCLMLYTKSPSRHPKTFSIGTSEHASWLLRSEAGCSGYCLLLKLGRFGFVRRRQFDHFPV